MISQLRFPQPRLVTDIQSAVFSEAEISHAPLDEDLADQHSAWIPHVYAVAAAAVDVAFGVAFDAVGHAGVGDCEEAAVCEEWSYIRGVS
jgi:hypothetical protein